jgi:hypothetical protein
MSKQQRPVPPLYLDVDDEPLPPTGALRPRDTTALLARERGRPSPHRDRRKRPRNAKRWYKCKCGLWWGKNKHFRCYCGELPPPNGSK